MSDFALGGQPKLVGRRNNAACLDVLDLLRSFCFAGCDGGETRLADVRRGKENQIRSSILGELGGRCGNTCLLFCATADAFVLTFHRDEPQSTGALTTENKMPVRTQTPALPRCSFAQN